MYRSAPLVCECVCVCVYRSVLDVCELHCVCVCVCVRACVLTSLLVCNCQCVLAAGVLVGVLAMESGSQWESLLVAVHSSPRRLPGPAGVTRPKSLPPAAGDEGQREGSVPCLHRFPPLEMGVSISHWLVTHLVWVQPLLLRFPCLHSTAHGLCGCPALGPRD